MSETVTYRPATEADAREAARLLMLALHDLDAQAGRPPRDETGESAEPALRHLVRTDPQRFWMAEAGGTPVGFGAAMVRGTVEVPGALWFLAGLFIDPAWQKRGIGKALLARTLEGCPAPDGVLAVVTSAANAQSNTMYAHCGMYPLEPLLSLSRELPSAGGALARAGASARGFSEQAAGEEAAGGLSARSGDRAALAVDFEVVPIQVGIVEQLRAVDEAVLGIDRTVDHLWMLGEMGRAGWLFLRGGAPVGYGYLGGDGSQIPDQVGPITTLDPQYQPTIAAHLLERAVESGWTRATFVVPGSNLVLQRFLWERGFAMHGTSELIGVSRPFGHFDRYAFLGDTLM